LQTPPPLCDFKQWIDTEIKESDKRLLQCRACRDIREETQRRGLKEGAQGRGGKKTCCCGQGGEGKEA